MKTIATAQVTAAVKAKGGSEKKDNCHGRK
jgi:hypothetical protein